MGVHVSMPCRGCGVQVRVAMSARFDAWCAPCKAAAEAPAEDCMICGCLECRCASSGPLLDGGDWDGALPPPVDGAPVHDPGGLLAGDGRPGEDPFEGLDGGPAPGLPAAVQADIAAATAPHRARQRRVKAAEARFERRRLDKAATAGALRERRAAEDAVLGKRIRGPVTARGIAVLRNRADAESGRQGSPAVDALVAAQDAKAAEAMRRMRLQGRGR